MQFPPEFLETYQEAFHTPEGKAFSKTQRATNKELAYSDWIVEQERLRREAANALVEAARAERERKAAEILEAREAAHKAREQARQEAAEAKAALYLNRSEGPDQIEEEPIASAADTHAEALEKIVGHSLRSMTPSDAIKHRGQLLKLAGDTVLLDRKAKIEKQSMASGLSIITELFRQVADGTVKQGPGWIDAVTLPTLSAKEQATEAVRVGESLETPSGGLSGQREAI